MKILGHKTKRSKMFSMAKEIIIMIVKKKCYYCLEDTNSIL